MRYSTPGTSDCFTSHPGCVIVVVVAVAVFYLSHLVRIVHHLLIHLLHRNIFKSPNTRTVEPVELPVLKSIDWLTHKTAPLTRHTKSLHLSEGVFLGALELWKPSSYNSELDSSLPSF